MLHGVIFLAIRLMALEKEIHCKLQETCHMSQSHAQLAMVSKDLSSRCKTWNKDRLCAIVASPNKLGNKLLRACYTLQPTCNLSCNAVATKVARKKLYRVRLALEAAIYRMLAN